MAFSFLFFFLEISLAREVSHNSVTFGNCPVISNSPGATVGDGSGI